VFKIWSSYEWMLTMHIQFISVPVWIVGILNCLFVSRLGYAVTRIIVVISTWIIVGFFRSHHWWNLVGIETDGRGALIGFFDWFTTRLKHTCLVKLGQYFVIIDSSGKPGIGLFLSLIVYLCRIYKSRMVCGTVDMLQ